MAGDIHGEIIHMVNWEIPKIHLAIFQPVLEILNVNMPL